MADVVEALIELLTSDDTLMSLVTDVVFLSGDADAEYPLVIIGDQRGKPAYTFDGIDTIKSFVDIEVAASATEEAGAYSQTKQVLERIYNLLQDLDEGLTATDSGETICLRRMDNLPGFRDVRSNGEIYLRRGHEWEIWSGFNQ